MTSSEIRQQFLDFFASKAHQIVPSAPIVVKNDPTLLFTNAGMNQFKDYFLGNKEPQSRRIADTQKCLRVSGKHNDLEEVGVDTYHHTMFEMLGNWSFGDYFKTEAIAWSWELLTEVYKLDKDRLYVTIFEGDEKEGLPRDTEAYNEWKKVIAEDRILLGKKKDNFWEMGDTGPCGPCTEIHVDCRSNEERAAVDGKTLVNNDHPQVIEIWNNVFIQFNRLKDGSLEALPAKHVDTGMGFERLARVIQGKQSNYDTDVFSGTIHETEKISGLKYENTDSKKDVAFRVIADHIRAIAFTIADGQLPANTGAGYVIRRILRRAVRYYFSYLDYKQPLLHQLMPLLAEQFAQVFPELKQQLDFVSKVVKEEEEAFLRTLGKGIERFNAYLRSAKDFPNSEKLLVADDPKALEFTTKQNGSVEFNQAYVFEGIKEGLISGQFAFELYDTYGFPVDLTELIARENGYKGVDRTKFEELLKQQKDRSRAATAIDTDDWVVVNEAAGKGFVGYEDILVETHVQRYRKITAKGKQQFQLVLATTPFYPEGGGQQGDTGILHFGGEQIAVTDTRKENDLIIHFVNQLPTAIDIPVKAQVNTEQRLNTMYNHTATHLMHAALRQVLGKHVAQKGSLVNDAYLRFDFSHFAKMTDEEIREVEVIVNNKIRENIPVVIKQMPKEEAINMGAMALFGEKYADTVRVVIIDPNYSIELCGGTHVGHTGMIGLFSIQSEAAVAAGVRRIEAFTGPAAFNFLLTQFTHVKEIGSLLKAKEPLKAVEKLLQEKAALEKKVEKLEAMQLQAIQKELLASIQTINGKQFLGAQVDVSSADALKKLAYDLRLQADVVVLTANIAEKASVAISVSDAASTNIDAGKLIKDKIAPLIKGGGGGQKTLATAGGQDSSQLAAVIKAIQESI
jgi:alanyl-tRNA synthetase